MEKVEIKHFKALKLPTSAQPDSIYYVLDSVRKKVKTYITDSSGIPIPLIDLAGEGMIESVTGTAVNGTITNPTINISTFLSTELGNLVKLSSVDGKLKVNRITSPDLSLEIVNTPSELQIKIANSLLEKINNALQPEDISQYTDEQAQDAIGNIVADTATIDLVYNDITPEISASVKLNSITTSELSTGVNSSLNLANTSVQPLNIQNFFNKLVDDTDDISEGTIKKFTTTAEKNFWNSKQENLVSGTNIKTIEGQSILGSGNIDLTKSDVGLSNVDNTSDLNKPTPAATQTALDNKVDKNTNIVAGTNTKITYDAKGLVIAGTSLLASDVPILNQNTTGTSSTITGSIAQAQVANLVADLASKQPAGSYATGTGTVSGTNTGDNATNTQYSGLVTNANHTGDATGSTVLTLATVNANVGSFGSASSVPQYTVNAKGLTTASANVPIAIAQSQVNNLGTDLGLKANLASPTFTGTVSGITATMVGLGNVTNTSDANKPVSTAQQTALDLKVTANAAIVAGTNTKITYDAKGLVTAGTTLIASDIPTIAQSQVTNLVSDLASKVTTIGTTGNIQRIVGTNQLGNSALVDNGTSVTSSLPFLSTGSITGNSFVKASAGTTNILLAGGADITQLSLPISSATQSALDLKANLVSPTFTGSPTAPTAPAGTNTTQVATTAFVGSAVSTADAGNVKLTGNQSISGVKTFNGNTVFQNGGAGSIITANSNAPGSTGFRSISTGGGTADHIVLQNASGAVLSVRENGAMTSTNTITATSFINSTAPAGNVLLAGGGTLAQTGLPYLPLTGGTLTGALNGTRALFGTDFWVKSSAAKQLGNLNLDNGLTDSPALLFHYGNSKNFGIDSSINSFRIVKDLDETTGVVLMDIKDTGAATFSSTVTASNFIATTGTIRLKGFTVATLPAGVIGDTAYVTDAVAPSYLVTVMGGGAVATVVFYNGTNWVSH